MAHKFDGSGTRLIRFRHSASREYDIASDKVTNPPLERGHANALMFDGSVRVLQEGQVPVTGEIKNGIDGNELWHPF